MLSIFMECVSILRAMSEREVKFYVGDIVVCLVVMGFVRFILLFFVVLFVLEGIG